MKGILLTRRLYIWVFGMLLNTNEVGNLAPIGVVSFLCNEVEQKDLTDSGEPLFKWFLPFRF